MSSLVHLDEDEHRRLALHDPLEQVGVVPVALGQLGQLVRELQQQLQPVGLLERQEVVADLGEGGSEVRRTSFAQTSGEVI